ncbi:O-antigen polymerase [Streptomyces pluripotens]|uniref:O-antigen polymerase n=2 Tax=Streptomyces TaxID=1883 RepID=A0A221PAK2_9ACTN|nr:MULTISPECIES: O-antigen polymerase [Streptomyces]ARP74540.1 O-antigen polymerase [Streptomyces pluripotens]ASN28815.1 O-antigen polymerase [Streptomyces pluripotens]MCH0557331.1 O-antigen polymerase [Streptomyces sp. MUM 16J]
MILLGACAGWSLITAAAQGGRPEGMLLAILAVTAGYAAGRVSGALLPAAAPCAGAAAGLTLVVVLPGLSPSSRYAAPLGHAGAAAALLALATGAAACAAWATPVPALRLGLRALAVGIVLAGAALGLVAGCAAGALVLLCSLAAGSAPRRGVCLLALAVAVALTAGTTWAIAADALPDGISGILEGRIGPYRIQLWQDALRLAGANRTLGVGPGRFGELSHGVPGKPHSAPLQQAAEQGLAGLFLLIVAFGWVLYALWRTPRSTPVALTAGAALAGLAILATVSNALSFTPVTAGAGLVAGWATARPWTSAGPRPDNDEQ